MQRQYPNVNVQDNVLFTACGRLFSSAGIASGIDLALHIVEKEMGPYMAFSIARELVVYTRRSGHDDQQSELTGYRNHIHNGIHAVQDWLHENLHTKTHLDRLAEIAHMSTRNFTRTFKKETGITVGDYIAKLRLEKSRILLKNPDLSRLQIATAVGLDSTRQLSRLLGGR